MTYTQAQIDRANAANLEDFLRAQGDATPAETTCITPCSELQCSQQQ